MILYSTGCPKCKILIKKLQQAGINYELCDDINIMQEKKITTLPVLEVGGELLEFKEAVNYVNNNSKGE